MWATLAFWIPHRWKLPLQLKEVMYTLTRINNRHAHTQKTDVERIPLGSRSLWVIIWDSLPLTSKYGWVCERESGRQNVEPPSWCQSSGTVSLTMTGNSQEGMSGMQESRKCCSLMHVCKNLSLSTHAPCAPTHTHVMFFASSLSGEISLPVKSYPTPPPPTHPPHKLMTPYSQHQFVWGLWLNVVFPLSLKAENSVTFGYKLLCCLESKFAFGKYIEFDHDIHL